MTTRDAAASPPHAEAHALAWYVSGALPAAERRQLEAHLQSCDQCRTELASIKALRADVRAALDSEPGPALRVRQSVFRNIHAAGLATDAGGMLARLTAWLRRPLLPRWLATAALLLIVVQTGMLLGTINGRRQPAPLIATRALANAPARLAIRFRPMATDTQIRELLSALGARIVDGPTPSGAYVVEMAGSDPKLLGQRLAAARTRRDVLLSVELAPP